MRSRSTVSLALLIAAAPGCIAVAKHNLREREPVAMACSPGLSTSLALSFDVTGAQVKRSSMQRFGGDTDRALREQLAAHPCLRVSADGEPSDRHVDVRIREHVNPRMALAVLSGVTMTLIPAVSSFDATVTVDVWSGDTILASRTWSIRGEVYIQLFLVFAMPSRSPRRHDERLTPALASEVVAVVESTLLRTPAPFE